MFCTSCGKEIDNDSNFCTYCGAKQIEEKPAAADVSKDVPIEPVREADESVSNDSYTDLPHPVTPNGGGMVTTSTDPNPVTPPVYEPKPAPSVNPEIPDSGNNTRKKKSSFLLVGAIAVVAILLALLLFGGKGGYKDYRQLVKDYYTAIYKKDFNALLKCYDKEDQKDMKEDKEDYKDELKEIKDEYDDLYDRGWYKKVKIKSRSKIDEDDDVSYYRVYVEVDDSGTDSITVKKYKNRFYIDSDSDKF